jgi:hypothetical protein
MSRVPILSTFVSLSLFAFGPIGAMAASPSEQVAACEAQSTAKLTCTYNKTGGDVSCNCVGTTGASDNSQPISDNTNTKGNLDNKPQKDTKCTGPGSSGDTSSFCP